MDAALPASAALEPKFGVQVQQVFFQMFDPLTSLHQLLNIHDMFLLKILTGGTHADAPGCVVTT